jgi:hypothetical protein
MPFLSRAMQAIKSNSVVLWRALHDLAHTRLGSLVWLLLNKLHSTSPRMISIEQYHSVIRDKGVLDNPECLAS